MTDNYKESIKKKIIIAIPKGRILKELEPMLKKVKITPEKSFYKNNRKLMFSTSDKNIIIIIVRSFDVANFVAFGGAT